MCEYSERLIAWMDGELAESEAAEVERHVRACAACRECVSVYEDASRQFAAYYGAATQVRPTAPRIQKVPLWIPVAAAVAAVAAMLAMAFMPRSAKQIPVVQQVAAIPSPVATAPIVHATSAVVQAVAKRHVAAHRKSHDTDWAMAEPAIQIAIPADAMFPPGAVPEGVTYIANVSLGANGLIQGIQLQP
jgi:anti-sigma factor RsiW